MLTWAQEPRLYDDGNGNHWWPHPSRFNFEAEEGHLLDTSQANCLMGAMFGRRSDDRLFFVPMEVPLDASVEIKTWATGKAAKKIDSYLDDNCQCGRFHICEWHQKRHGAVIEEGDQMPQC